jgi:hypothetical protein
MSLMNSSMRIPLPLQSSNTGPLPSPSRRSHSVTHSHYQSPRVSVSAEQQLPPGKVTTLDHIISQGQTKRDSFCGQTTRSSHDGKSKWCTVVCRVV